MMAKKMKPKMPHKMKGLSFKKSRSTKSPNPDSALPLAAQGSEHSRGSTTPTPTTVASTPTPPPIAGLSSTSTPQASNKTSVSSEVLLSPALPAPHNVNDGSDPDDYIKRESNLSTDASWSFLAHQSNVSTDDGGDSIMGMSTEGELVGNDEAGEDSNDDEEDVPNNNVPFPKNVTEQVENGGGGGGGLDDSWKNDRDDWSKGDGSQVSDEDYYRQDYFMLPFSQSERNVLDEEINGLSQSEHNMIDSNIASSSQDILDEIDTPSQQLSGEQMSKLTAPDSDTPTEDGTPAGSDYASDLNVDAENPLDIALPVAKKDYISHFADMLNQPSPEKGVWEEDIRPRSMLGSLKDDNEEMNEVPQRIASESSANSKGGIESPPKNPRRDNGFPFPATSPSSPKRSSSGKANIDTEESDFAAALRKAVGREIPSESKSSKRNEESDFASALRKAAGRETPDNESPTKDSNDFSSALKHAKLKHRDTPESNKLEKKSSSSGSLVDKPSEDKPRFLEGKRSEGSSAGKPQSIERNQSSDSSAGEVDRPERSVQFSTPKQNNYKSTMHNLEGHLAAMSPQDDSNYSPGTSPVTTPDVIKKVVKENCKLRKRRKELLTLLSSTAQQFSSYEKVCSQKICKLEEENKALRNNGGNTNNLERAKLDASSLAEMIKEETMEARRNAQSTGAPSKMYDGEVVRRLSNGVLIQEKQLKAKEELMTQLKLRCEVLKQSLMDKDGDILQEKKLWEDEHAKLLAKLESSSPMNQNHGELLSKKMEVTRLKQELDTALNDITMLTNALETNNVALDAAVLELDKLQEWKVKYGEAAATIVAPPEISRTTDAEKLRNELKEKDNELGQLQKDLESSLNEIEELRESVNSAAAAKGYKDFQYVVDTLKGEATVSKGGVEKAAELIMKLEKELKSKDVEMEKLHVAAARGASVSPENTREGPVSQSPGISDSDLQFYMQKESASRRGLFSRLRAPKPGEEGEGDYPTMVRQRDLKIKSMEAMIHSNTKIMDKMKGDIERMDNEKEEEIHVATQRIEKLEEEKKTFEMQVSGFEKAFMNLNDDRVSGAGSAPTLKPSQGDDDIVDEAMFMWDENEQDDGDSKEEDSEDLRAKNLDLQRMVTELQSNGSFQEDQIETLKAELVKLRVKSNQEKEIALAQVVEENKIVIAQRLALENQLVEINKSAGLLRNSMPDESDGGEFSGKEPILVSQVVMLENANKVLESSVDSLRGDMQEKLAPLLERVALLEEEKRMMEEEMETKLGCREMTISNLENSLQKYQSSAKKFHLKKKKGKSSSPDKEVADK